MVENWFDREQVVIVQGKRAKRYKSTDAPGVDDIPGLRSKMEVKTHKVMQDAKDRGIRLWIFSGGEAGGDTIFGKEAEEMGHRVFYNPAIADVKAGHITDPKIDVSGRPYHRIIDDRFMDIIPPAGIARRHTPIATRNYLDRQRGEDKNWRLVRRYLRDDPEGKIAAGTATTADLPLPQKWNEKKKKMVDQNWFADDFQFRNLANIHDATKKHEELSARPGTKTLPIISMTLHDKTREERGVVPGPKGGSFGNETKVLGINIPVFEIMTNKVTKPETRNTSQDFNSIWDAPKEERKAEDYSSTTGKPVVVVPVDKDGKISIGEGLAKLSESAPKTYEHQRLEFAKLLENPDIEIRKSTDIQSKDIINNPNAIFIFGDNTLRVGRGGQASVYRDFQNERNVQGIVTKYSPQKKFSDDDEAEEQQIEFQDKDFKSLWGKINLQQEQLSLEPFKDYSRAVTETKQDREEALDKLHTEELEEFQFGDSLPAMIETWEGKKGTFVSEKTKPIIEERLAAAEAKAGPTNRQKLAKARKKFASTLPDEIFLPSDSTKTGSYLFPTSFDQRKELDKPIGIKLNQEDKEMIARKAITLESDIDATGIETGQLIDILKDTPFGGEYGTWSARDPGSTIITEHAATSEDIKNGEKVDVTVEQWDSGIDFTGVDPESIAKIESYEKELGIKSKKGGQADPQADAVKKAAKEALDSAIKEIIPRQQIQERAISDILTQAQLEAIEERDYVSTANLKEWWNPKERKYIVPTHEQTFREGEFPDSPLTLTDENVFLNKLWVNPDDGKIYPLIDALAYKYRGVSLPSEIIGSHLSVVKDMKHEMGGRAPTLDDISTIMQAGTTTVPEFGAAGDVQSQLFFPSKDDVEGVFEDQKELSQLLAEIKTKKLQHWKEYIDERKHLNKTLLSRGKPTKEIVDFKKWELEVYPKQNNYEDSNILIDDLDHSLYFHKSIKVKVKPPLSDKTRAGTTIYKISGKPQRAAKNLLRTLQESTTSNYNELPATKRRQFEAYLGEFAATGIKPEGFQTAYENILLKMNVGKPKNELDWTLNQEELSGSPYFDIENGKLVSSEWDTTPKKKELGKFFKIRYQEAALMNPDSKLSDENVRKNVIQSIEFRIKRGKISRAQNRVILLKKVKEFDGKIRTEPITPDDIKNMSTSKSLNKEERNLFDKYIFKLRKERKDATKAYNPEIKSHTTKHVFPYNGTAEFPPPDFLLGTGDRPDFTTVSTIGKDTPEAYEQSTERKFLDLIDTDITNMSDDQKQGLLDKLRKIEHVPQVKDRQSMLENINGGMIYDEAGSRIPTKEGTHFKTFDKKPSELLDVKIAEIKTSFVSEPVDSFKIKADEEQAIIDETQLYTEAFTDKPIKVKPIDLKTEIGPLKDIHAKPVSGIPVITRRDLSRLDKRHGSLPLKPRTKAEIESLLTESEAREKFDIDDFTKEGKFKAPHVAAPWKIDGDKSDAYLIGQDVNGYYPNGKPETSKVDIGQKTLDDVGDVGDKYFKLSKEDISKQIGSTDISGGYTIDDASSPLSLDTSDFESIIKGKFKFKKDADKNISFQTTISDVLPSVKIETEKKDEAALYIREKAEREAQAEHEAQAARDEVARKEYDVYLDREAQKREIIEKEADKKQREYDSLTALQKLKEDRLEKVEKDRKAREKFDSDDWEENYARSFGEMGTSILKPIKSSDSSRAHITHLEGDITDSAKKKIVSDAVLNGLSGDPNKKGKPTNSYSLENNNIIGENGTVKDTDVEKRKKAQARQDRRDYERTKEGSKVKSDWNKKRREKKESSDKSSDKISRLQWAKKHFLAGGDIVSKIGGGAGGELARYRQQKLAMAEIRARGGGGRGAIDSLAANAALIKALSGASQQPTFGSTMGIFSKESAGMMGSGQSALTDFGKIALTGSSKLTDMGARALSGGSALTDMGARAAAGGSTLTDFSTRVGITTGHLGGALAEQMRAGEGGGTRGIFTMGEKFLRSRQEPTSLVLMKSKEKDITSFSLGGTLGLGASMRPEQGLGSPSGFLSGELIPQRQLQETQNRAPNGRNNGAGIWGRRR